MKTKLLGATEELLPEPTQAEIELQRLTDENAQLRLQIKHLQGALKIAANVLQPYFTRGCATKWNFLGLG
jgi:hypothetical protein